MKIKSIEIKNFRSLRDIKVQITHNLMCIVGKNDAGKSTVIKAIETFFEMRSFTENDFPFGDPNSTISEIIVSFETDIENLSEYTDDQLLIIRKTFKRGPSSVIKNVECYLQFKMPEFDPTSYSSLKKVATDLGIEFPQKKPKDMADINRLCEKVEEKLKKLSGSRIWKNISKEWSIIQQYLPEIILIPAAQDPENEQKMTSDSSAFGSLFRVGMRKMLHYDPEGKKAVSVLETKLAEINKDILGIVEEKLNEQGNSLSLIQKPETLDVIKGFSFKLEIEDTFGIKTPLSQRGNGLQRSVLMAIIRAQSDINKKILALEQEQNEEEDTSTEFTDLKRGYLYLIEEPEAFLHLSAQRELYYSIKELLKGGSQALITTHSTLFIDEGDFDQVVLLERNEGKTIAMQSLAEEEVKEAIGETLKISELMTGRVCCLVEGIADVNAFKQWMKILNYDDRELGIYFIDMKGCKNAEYYANVKVIKDFGVKFFVILDTDSHSRENSQNLKRTLINEYKVKDHQIIILSKGEIENYFPISTVEKVLNLDEGSIDKEAFDIDPKNAMLNAKESSNDRAKKYQEKRDSLKIAQTMQVEEIDPEIVDIIQQLVKAAGGEIIEI